MSHISLPVHVVDSKYFIYRYYIQHKLGKKTQKSQFYQSKIHKQDLCFSYVIVFLGDVSVNKFLSIFSKLSGRLEAQTALLEVKPYGENNLCAASVTSESIAISGARRRPVYKLPAFPRLHSLCWTVGAATCPCTNTSECGRRRRRGIKWRRRFNRYCFNSFTSDRTCSATCGRSQPMSSRSTNLLTL